MESQGEVTITRLWQKKEFSQDGDTLPSSLPRVLNQFDLVALGIGTAIGAGIFVITGTVAHDVSGPSVIVSFAIAGLAMIFNAMSYAEMAGRIPHSGSAYSYVYASCGEVWAWITGWDISLEYILAAATEARGATRHLALIITLAGGTFPTWLDNVPVAKGLISIDPIAFLVVVFITALLCLGTKGSAIFNSIMVIISLGIMLFIIVLGIPNVDPANWTPFMPFGINGIFAGTAIVAFAYLGFDCVAATSEEAKNPRKTIPRTFIIAVSVLAITYIVVSIIITGLTPYGQINKNHPLATAFNAKGYGWAMIIITIGGMASLLTTTYGALLPQARIWFAMARDGLMPGFFAKTNASSRAPVNATIVSGSLAALLALLIDLKLLARLVSIGAFFVFTMVNTSLLFMRYVNEDEKKGSVLRFKITYATYIVSLCLAAPALIFIPSAYYAWAIILTCIALFPFVGMFFFRPSGVHFESFHCPMVPFVPLVGIALNIYFMFNLGGYTWMRFGGGDEHDDDISVDDVVIDAETVPLTRRQVGTAPRSDLF